MRFSHKIKQKKMYYKVKNVCSVYNTEDKLVENKHLLLKGIQSVLNTCKNVKPNCETKWNVFFNREFEWNKIWTYNIQNFASRKYNQLNWKILHNVVYTEERLQRMGRSNGKCHFCKTESDTLTHLFFGCENIKNAWGKIFDAINTFFIVENIEIIPHNEETVILGRYDRNMHDCFDINTIPNTVKWVIWKIRNIIKYQKKNFSCQFLINAIKAELTFVTESVNKSTLQRKSYINNIKSIKNLINY